MSRLGNPNNPMAAMRIQRQAQETAETRHREVLEKVAAMSTELNETVKRLETRIGNLEAQNTELQTQIRQVQTQLADTTNTLKGVLPALKTQKAAEGRQGG